MSVFLAVGSWPTLARPFRVTRIPNGGTFGCANCHLNPAGGGPRNAFGLAVEAKIGGTSADVAFWDASLAGVDSDGDGPTNGEELGDPEGDGTPTGGATVTNPGRPLEILVQPESQTVGQGADVTFSVEATTTFGPLTYRWRKDGVNLGRSTSGTLTLTAVTPAQEGSYTVVVAGDLTGQVTSDAAILTVQAVGEIPSVSTQPESQAVNEGDDVTFIVEATGPNPFSYQWQKNGVDITGATNATFSLSTVTVADAGSYVATVSNTAGSATSDPATLAIGVGTMLRLDPITDMLILSFPGAVGVSYQLEYQDQVDSGTWTLLRSGVLDQNGIAEVPVEFGTAISRFFRVQVP